MPECDVHGVADCEDCYLGALMGDDTSTIDTHVLLGLIADRERLQDIIARAARLAESERAGLTLQVLGEIRETGPTDA